MAGEVVIEPGSGTEIVLAHLSRPYEPVRATSALLGLPPRSSQQLVGTVIATCTESEALLDAMPQILRSMAIATTDRPERCHDELRGPVLWAETMSVRSTSVGDPGLYVCATTTKAYDTVENRILKAALAAIVRGGHAATHGRVVAGDHLLRRSRHNEQRARHLLEHRTLSSVPIARVTGRMIRRTSAGTRRATYRPALAMLARAQAPLRAEHLQEHAPGATLAEHDLLAAALLMIDLRVADAPPLMNDAGGLTAGELRYDHLGGVTISGALMTTPREIREALDAALR